MIRKMKLLNALFLFVFIYSATLYGGDSISLTHIANCGYLVEIDSNKIIIDGIFKRGHNHYTVPGEATQKLLVSNQSPFDDIDLLLVTHTHEDHFDREMLTECMLNNPYVKLVCPQQVSDSIRVNEAAYDLVKSRIIVCTTDSFTSQLLQFGDIEVYACRFAHPGKKFKDTQNIAYLVSVGGRSVFHSADIDPAQIDKYTGVKLNEQDIDVALVNEDFAKIENAGITREFINAKYNIAIHLPEAAEAVWLESLKDKPGLFSNPVIFRKELENKVLYFEREE